MGWTELQFSISPALQHTSTAGSVTLTNDLNTPNVKVGADEEEGVGWFVVPTCFLLRAGTKS